MVKIKNFRWNKKHNLWQEIDSPKIKYKEFGYKDLGIVGWIQYKLLRFIFKLLDRDITISYGKEKDS